MGQRRFPDLPRCQKLPVWGQRSKRGRPLEVHRPKDPTVWGDRRQELDFAPRFSGSVGLKKKSTFNIVAWGTSRRES